MSPEAVFESNVGKEGDLWGLGILLYEMLHGKPPFEVEDLGHLKKQMLKSEIFIRKDFSNGSKDLLKKLLRKDKNLRMKLP